MPKLFEEEDSEAEVKINTNTDYANKYNTWRKKEELYHLSQKYGDSFKNESEDSSSSDDDLADLEESFEKNFFKALSCLKNRDPKIYDVKVDFFPNKNTEEGEKVDKKKVKKTKPLFFKDYERKIILEDDGKFSDPDENEDIRSQSPTYVQEQQRLKESFKEALKDEGDDKQNWGGMFQKRQKTKAEEEQEEEDYRKWLKGQKTKLDNENEESELKSLRDFWNNPELNEGEAYLRDYLLNRRYLEKVDETHIPTYDEIVHDSDEGLSEDEKAIEKQEEFEHKYNFRYEEPDQEFIKRYPRIMDQSVRKTDDRRKLKREELKERKLEKKKEQKEELKQLKILKRSEIEDKIRKLKEITGNDTMAFEDKDLDGDFDPDAHDRRMHELFNDDYYGGAENVKPEYSDLEEELGPWKDGNELHCEDENFNMDCDYDPSTSKKSKNEKKKRNKPGKALKDEAVFEEDEHFKEYEDEYYKLDYEDMIGDIPCRFKYREVLPNTFGLTIEEILLAKPQELNNWCSLKKIIQHRPEHIEKYDVVAYERKSRNEDLKRKVLPSLYGNLEENVDEDDTENNYINLDEDDVFTNNKEDSKMQVDNSFEQDFIKIENKNEGNKLEDKIKEEKQQMEKSKKHKNSKKTETRNDSTNKENSAIDKLTRRQKKNKKNKLKTNTKAATNSNGFEENKKQNISSQNDAESNNVAKKKAKMIKKLKIKQKINTSTGNESTDNFKGFKKNKKRKLSSQNDTDQNNVPKKKKISNKNSKKNEVNISNSRLEAYGINPKKFKNKMKYKPSTQ